jgi:hypothetical protein
MAMTPTMTPNMGVADRLARGSLGGLLLVNGITHFQNSIFRRWETLLGGAFLVYGLTGFDPLLKFFGASTIPNAENNVLNMIQQIKPGQGMHPQQTEQAIPKQPTRGINTTLTLSEALMIH